MGIVYGWPGQSRPRPRRYQSRERIPDPPVIVMEKLDGTYHLEGRDWFFIYDPVGGKPADEMAACVEVLRRKWLIKQARWLEQNQGVF